MNTPRAREDQTQWTWPASDSAQLGRFPTYRRMRAIFILLALTAAMFAEETSCTMHEETAREGHVSGAEPASAWRHAGIIAATEHSVSYTIAHLAGRRRAVSCASALRRLVLAERLRPAGQHLARLVLGLFEAAKPSEARKRARIEAQFDLLHDGEWQRRPAFVRNKHYGSQRRDAAECEPC